MKSIWNTLGEVTDNKKIISSDWGIKISTDSENKDFNMWSI